MRHCTSNLIVACLTAVLLAACGGGGGGSSSGGGTPNSPPTANAGPNQTVNAGSTVTLNGSASSDSDGSIATYAWTQTAGTAVTLSAVANAQPTFVAPDVNVATTLTFSLIVTDNRFTASSAAKVNVIVNPLPNVAPTANAGANQTVTSGLLVTLNGTASSDSDGSVEAYAWTQTAGAAVTLTGADTALPTFGAPTVTVTTTLTFSLLVTDNRGAVSTAATTNVTVNAAPAGTTNVSGTVTYTRIPTTAQNGLNYSAPILLPARGIMVRAVNLVGGAVVATASTSSTGSYVLNVINSITIRIELVSQMTRTGALPNWNFTARDLSTAGSQPYVYTDNVTFASNSGGTHDIAIPSGFNLSGTVTGTRASAPFAVLDTVYQGVQTILNVAPTTNFPALVLDWAPDNVAGETFFTTTDENNQPLQNIVLSADVAADTDEFDQHVIAHEFGHYIEYNFSRADNIGGSHGLGDKLDIRTAFGEGFGYAFAAIVLNDPDARDTFVNTNGVRQTSRFNIETNPPATAPSTTDSNYGCWCSESSVWSILWDLYDSTNDANDTVSLGFSPLWKVLISPEKNTPAVTSIFSFITALKAANASSATAINTLVAAQNISATNMDAFGTTETHVPTEVASIGALPVTTTATIGGGAVIVQSVNDAGHFNTLGNHRFIKFDVATTRIVTITATTSNASADADPDFQLFRNGVFIIAGESSVVRTETVSNLSLQAGTYILDVYDCANGCSGTTQGTPGDYALTVTIN